MSSLTRPRAHHPSQPFTECGQFDAYQDRFIGTQDQYATALASFVGGALSAPSWQQYRAAYDAEWARLADHASLEFRSTAIAPCSECGAPTYFSYIAPRNISVSTAQCRAAVETVITDGTRRILIDTVIRPRDATDPERQHRQVVTDVVQGEYGHLLA